MRGGWAFYSSVKRSKALYSISVLLANRALDNKSFLRNRASNICFYLVFLYI